MQLSYIPKVEFARILQLDTAREERARLFADACRVNALYMIARAGSGHIGSSFSCLDILSWLYLEEMRDPGGDGDLFFSSKGHDAPGMYAVMTALGIIDFEGIHQLRRLGGLPGHPDVETPGVITNTGPLGMGISKAKGMIQANRLLGRDRRVYVLTGDGELQEGQVWESLASAVRDRMGELTVIVDHNKVQSDTWVSEVSDLGDIEAKFRAFGWTVARCDGHDATALGRHLATFAQVTDSPKVLIADTLKGRGVRFMEPDAMDPIERLYRFHSGAPAPDAYETALLELVEAIDLRLDKLDGAKLTLDHVDHTPASPPENPQRLVAAYSRELVRQAEQNPRLVALDADLILDCGIIPFSKRFPERFFECGIAEQDMVSQAGGMALQGLLPVVHSFACFLSTRPNEQIYNNATEQTKIVYVAPLAGLVPSGPGHSHQSVRDISTLGSNPGLVMIEPSCEAEVAEALDYCVNRSTESCYLRLVSIPVEVPYSLPEDYRLEPGVGVTLREGRDAAIIGYGPVLLAEAWKAADILSRQNGLEVGVVNLPWLNRIDAGWLRDIAERYGSIFTLDDHYVALGQGQMIGAALAELGLSDPPAIRYMGVRDIPACGTNAEALRAHGLDAASLAEAVARQLTGASAVSAGAGADGV